MRMWNSTIRKHAYTYNIKVMCFRNKIGVCSRSCVRLFLMNTDGQTSLSYILIISAFRVAQIPRFATSRNGDRVSEYIYMYSNESIATIVALV